MLRTSRIFFLSFCFVSSHAFSAPLIVSGIAQQNYFNEPAYIGALLLEKRINDANELSKVSGEQIIEIQFLNSRYPMRIFSDHIIGWADLNNLRAKQAFSNIDSKIRDVAVRRNFIKGDRLQFKKTPSSVTEVSFNKTVILTTADTELFNYMASAWLGNNTANAEFKESILSLDVNDSITTDLLLTFYKDKNISSMQQLASTGLIPDAKAPVTTNEPTKFTANNNLSLSTHKQLSSYDEIESKLNQSLAEEINASDLAQLESVKIYFNQAGAIITANPVTDPTLLSNQAESLKEELHDAIIKAAKNISPLPIRSDISSAGIFSVTVKVQ